jgi:hypothetical protein
MTEPIDPNGAWAPAEPVGYQPPPPFAPPPADAPSPWNAPPQDGPGGTGPPQPWLPVAGPHVPPRSRRSRLPLFLGVLLALVAAAGVLVFVAVHGSDSRSSSGPQRLVLPDSFDGYTGLAGAQADQFESSMKSFAAGFAGGALDRATIRGYTHELGEQPALMVFVFPTPSLPSTAPAASGGLAASLRALLGRSVRDYPAGPHGGELLCGGFRIGAMSEPMCVWSDRAVTGVMVSIEHVPPHRLSEVADDLRDLVH